MSDNLNKKVLLVGAGQMAVDYYNVLQALHCETTTIGRGENSASRFEEKTGSKIVINKEFKNILIEKPAGLNDQEIKELAEIAAQQNASVVVAYNRRFYSSVLKAKEIIDQDGGVTSFNFEFTEWAHTIEPLIKANGIKENWLLANSSHVIDLAFYLGGKPSKINCYSTGNLSWHDKAIFVGAGKTKDNILFSYQANWDAPGRWGVEILTNKSRLILRPLEELQIQLKGSIAINKVEIDSTIDKQFKPGLFLQTKQFLTGKLSEFKTIQEQSEMCEIYTQIAKGN
jgi:hypothetical protein